MERFGKYLLLEKLAAGGMAEVYLSRMSGATGINKFVAIKRILPEHSNKPEYIDWFRGEASIAVNLNHSNIVSIFDFGVEKSQFYLVMEFVEGQNLRQILNHMKKEAKDFSLEQIVYVVKEVAAGLDHAHRCLDGSTGRPLNISHRDMSPQNVMVSFEGEIKIVDFGIAKAETQLEQTKVGTIKGKFGYMSPEQAEGQELDPRTDIFSLGIVLWELLAKDRLFVGQNEAATLRKVTECQIPSLRKINPNLPPEIERICMKALAKDKSLRYQTAAAFHKDLNRFLNTQFPEFSTQEFSKFMKSLYHKMYLENRRKLAEYARLSVDDDSESTVVTETETVSMPSVSGLPPPPSVQMNEGNLDKMGISEDSKRIDLGSLKMEEGRAKGKMATSRTQFNRNGTNPVMHGTHTGYRTGTKTGTRPVQYQKSSSSPMLAIMLILVGLGLGGFYAWHNQMIPPELMTTAKNYLEMSSQITPTPGAMPVATPEPVQPKRSIVPINIQSKPSGAFVYLDGRNLGLTPLISHIEEGREFRITIRKEGYLPYDRSGERAQGNYALMANLQPEPPMGYVSIEIIAGGANPVVTINGQRIEDRSQLSRYPIPAGVPVKIKAVNPFAQVSAEETVVVGQAQKKTIRLILSKDRR